MFVASKDYLESHPSFAPLDVCGSPAVTMTHGPNGMQISAAIYGRNGRRMGRIDNNGYEIDYDADVTVEHSGDLSTIVVHNAAKDELLYVRYLNHSTMRVRGIFACPAGQPAFTITDEDISPPVVAGPACMIESTIGIFAAHH